MLLDPVAAYTRVLFMDCLCRFAELRRRLAGQLKQQQTGAKVSGLNQLDRARGIKQQRKIFIGQRRWATVCVANEVAAERDAVLRRDRP